MMPDPPARAPSIAPAAAGARCCERGRRTSRPGVEVGVTMKTLSILIGVFVILVLLVSSGAMGGAMCLRGVGCIYSSGTGVAIDNSETVTVSTGP